MVLGFEEIQVSLPDLRAGFWNSHVKPLFKE
jgi:hypothetical protein